MIIEPSVGDRPRNGRAVMISARRIAATVPPMNVARPPESAAPPKHGGGDAVQREGVADLCVADRRSGHDEERGDGAQAALRAASARTRTQLVLTPPRFADRSSKPTARTSRPDPEAWSHRSSRPAADDDDDERHGDRPDASSVRTDTRSGLMTPWAVGRRVSEIPSRMLSVASVAMIDGILSPRIRPALTRPRARPHEEDDADPDHDLGRRTLRRRSRRRRRRPRG